MEITSELSHLEVMEFKHTRFYQTVAQKLELQTSPTELNL